MKKRCCVLLMVMIGVLSPQAEALKVWARESPRGGIVRDFTYESLKDLSLADYHNELKEFYLYNVVKMVVEESDEPFRPFKYISLNYLIIKKFKNLYHLTFDGVDFNHGRFVAGTFQGKSIISWIYNIESLNLVSFIRCKGSIILPDAAPPKFLRRVVSIDDQGNTEDLIPRRQEEVPVDLIPRRKRSIWGGLASMLGSDWLMERAAKWQGALKEFKASQGNKLDDEEIPEEIEGAKFIGIRGFSSVTRPAPADMGPLVEAASFFENGKIHLIHYLAINEGTLYWAYDWHRFSGVRKILLRYTEAMPNGININWEDVKFPPLLEEVQVRGGTMRQDEIEELKQHLPKEVVFTEVAIPGRASPPTQ